MFYPFSTLLPCLLQMVPASAVVETQLEHRQSSIVNRQSDDPGPLDAVGPPSDSSRGLAQCDVKFKRGSSLLVSVFKEEEA